MTPRPGAVTSIWGTTSNALIAKEEPSTQYMTRLAPILSDIQALDNVRDHVARKQAEADVNSELGDAEIGSKLKKIQAQAGTATARNKLEALKKARDSERAQKAGAAQAVKKQI